MQRGYIRTPEKTYQVDDVPKYVIDNHPSTQGQHLLHFIIESGPSASVKDDEGHRKKRQTTEPRIYEINLELHTSFPNADISLALSYFNDVSMAQLTEISTILKRVVLHSISYNIKLHI